MSVLRKTRGRGRQRKGKQVEEEGVVRGEKSKDGI